MFSFHNQKQFSTHVSITLSTLWAGREKLEIDYGNNGFNSALHLSQACLNYLLDEKDTYKTKKLLQDAFIEAALPPLREIQQVAAGLTGLLPVTDVNKATSLEAQAEDYIKTLKRDDISFSTDIHAISVFIEQTSVDLKSLQQTAVEHRERNKNFWKKPVWYIPVLLAGVAAVAGLWTIIMK